MQITCSAKISIFHLQGKMSKDTLRKMFSEKKTHNFVKDLLHLLNAEVWCDLNSHDISGSKNRYSWSCIRDKFQPSSIRVVRATYLAILTKLEHCSLQKLPFKIWSNIHWSKDPFSRKESENLVGYWGISYTFDIRRKAWELSPMNKSSTWKSFYLIYYVGKVLKQFCEMRSA